MKIYLAAIETGYEHSRAVELSGVQSLLTSFYYAAWNRTAPPRNWAAAMRQASARLIDSGAFTLRTTTLNTMGVARTDKQIDVDYDAYVNAYVRWLRLQRQRGLADWWVEVDVGAMLGQEWLHRQRRCYIEEGLGGGLVNVWHSECDWAYWIYLLKEACAVGRSRYVAIEGRQTTRQPIDYTKFLREAYRRGVRVHGFKMTGADDLYRWPFYSVDSSSWMSVSAFGTSTFRRPSGSAMVVRTGWQTARRAGSVSINGRPRAEKPTESRAAYRRAMPCAVPRGAGRLDRLAALVESARVWVDSEKALTRMWEARGVRWEDAVAHPELVEACDG